MKNCIRKIIIGLIIIGGSLFAFSNKTYGLEDIINKESKKVQADSTNLKEERKEKKKKITNYNINAGGMYNDVSNSGYFRSGLTLTKKIEIEFVYDCVSANKNVKEILEKESKSKEKKLLIASCQYNLNKYGIIGILYDSDGVIGLYSTLFKGGFKKTFSNGLANGLDINGFMGVKVGKVNFSKEKEDVLGASMIYKMPRQYTNNIINFSLKGNFHLPRRYIKDNMFEGPWVGQVIALVKFPVVKGIEVGLEYNIRRDYIPGPDISLIRKGINLNLSIASN